MPRRLLPCRPALRLPLLLALATSWLTLPCSSQPRSATSAYCERLQRALEVLRHASLFEPSEAELCRAASRALHDCSPPSRSALAAALPRSGSQSAPSGGHDDGPALWAGDLAALAQSPARSQGLREEQPGLTEPLAETPKQLQDELLLLLGALPPGVRTGQRQDDLLTTALQAMSASLNDPYTRYLTAAERAELDQRIEGVDELGLGLAFESLDGGTHHVVSEVFEGGGAAAAGLREGDELLAIDREPARGVQRATLRAGLRAMAAAHVEVSWLRNGVEHHHRLQHCVRPIPVVSARVTPQGPAYLRIRSFSTASSQAAEDALRQLGDTTQAGLVLDLRDNRGGLVWSAVELCSLLLPRGTPITTVVERGHRPQRYVALAAPDYPGPLPAWRGNHGVAPAACPPLGGLPPRVRQPERLDRRAGRASASRYRLAVLVNERTASAAELCAAALVESGGATALGQVTFGKAHIQELFDQPDGSALRITTARYLTPLGHDLHAQHGFRPTVVLPPTRYAPFAEDPAIAQACRALAQALPGTLGCAANTAAGLRDQGVPLQAAAPLVGRFARGAEHP